MTRQERRKPDLIKASRRKRIAAGAGVGVPEVNKLLKMHRQMADMMKKVGKKGPKGLLSGFTPPGGGGGPDPALIERMKGATSGGLPGLPGGDTKEQSGGLPGLGGAPQLGPDGLPIGFGKK
jgi:signal recognition particle subunit SRP54